MDNGNSWMQINSGLTNKTVYALAINSSNHIFAGTGGGIFRSIDNGDSWEQKGLTGRNIHSFDLNPTGHIFAGGSGSYVYRSTTNGDSWIEKYLGSLYYGSVYAILINSAWRIFVGTNYYLFTSSNNGDSWEKLNTTWHNTKDLAINSLGYIFAASDSGIFRSIDNGVTWTKITNGLLNLDVQSLMINTSDHIFAGTYGGGVYHSENNGDSWNPINMGLTNPFVLALTISPSGHLFAGTWGNGIFCSIQSTTPVEEIEGGLPRSYVLQQNYPNPFNPETVIYYLLPKQTELRLEIYNIAGQLVRTLVEERQPAGYYSANWNGKDEFGREVASGIYFYNLRTKDFVQTRKMLLVR